MVSRQPGLSFQTRDAVSGVARAAWVTHRASLARPTRQAIRAGRALVAPRTAWGVISGQASDSWRAVVAAPTRLSGQTVWTGRPGLALLAEVAGWSRVARPTVGALLTGRTFTQRPVLAH